LFSQYQRPEVATILFDLPLWQVSQIVRSAAATAPFIAAQIAGALVGVLIASVLYRPAAGP
jgi:glycerol uptake facilitator-like aquaporin